MLNVRNSDRIQTEPDGTQAEPDGTQTEPDGTQTDPRWFGAINYVLTPRV